MAIFTHVLVGTNDLGKAAEFYDQVLEPLGIKRTQTYDTGYLYGSEEPGPGFGIVKPFNGEKATQGNGTMVSFAAPSRSAVHQFHEQALAAGGTSEGEPGPRAFGPTAYAAYVRDLDGNKLSTYCFAAE